MPEEYESARELNLIERFLVAFNALDSHLQRVLGNESPNSFRSAVDLYARRHKWWRDAELLRTCAGLRNILVHDKFEPYEYPCVPTEALVTRLEAARDRLLHPQRAIPKFGRDVVTVQNSDSLAHVLRLVHSLKYSHFPVYEYSKSTAKFRGVLTENGITRWLAQHSAQDDSLIDLADEPVSAVLLLEEKRHNYEFAEQQARVEEILYRFHENTYLEAVLLTAHGHENEKLVGIVTRWDALQAD